MERKQISKSVRFEVFKRDKFTCQYCGKSAPDVILEVDHIKPVSKGGTNEILNLVTSCRDCNRGKTNRELSDNTAIAKQKRQMDAIQERREQLEMMLKWREALNEEEEIEVDSVESLFAANTKWTFSEIGRKNVKKLIRRFGFQEVYDAAEISIFKYYDGSERSWNNTFNKIGGICYNRMKARETDAEPDN